MAGLRIIRPGLLTTVQDAGRWGFQNQGVPVAGPMDERSHRLANRLVGNDDGAAALEVTLVGPELEWEMAGICAVTGAEFTIELDGEEVAMNRAWQAPAGGRLRFGPRRRGARAYLAVAGGFDVEPVLGSRATHLPSRIGPFGGRALKAGDRLPVGSRLGPPSFRPAAPAVDLPTGQARLRVLPGPEAHLFDEDLPARLESFSYLVTPQSNRMGYRLEGPALVPRQEGDMLSDVTPMGSIQVPPSGQPILLMADRQTTGGYARVATVITADLPVAGQLAPGDTVRFAVCDLPGALDALARGERLLAAVRPAG